MYFSVRISFYNSLKCFSYYTKNAYTRESQKLSTLLIYFSYIVHTDVWPCLLYFYILVIILWMFDPNSVIFLPPVANGSWPLHYKFAQRAVIRFLWSERVKRSEVHEGSALSCRNVFLWVKKFKSREDVCVTYEESLSRPSTALQITRLSKLERCFWQIRYRRWSTYHD